jgi:hypothetical protein
MASMEQQTVAVVVEVLVTLGPILVLAQLVVLVSLL